VFGPGNINQAHQPNEYLPRAHIARGRQILGRVIERYCVNS
jgi:acetylornithine deacetylase